MPYKNSCVGQCFWALSGFGGVLSLLCWAFNDRIITRFNLHSKNISVAVAVAKIGSNQ